MKKRGSAMGNLVNNPNIFAASFKGKRVLVTGHTGFKGSWLCLWLLKLKARVAGFSLYLPSDPCNFEILALKDRIAHYEGDICDIGELKKIFKDFRPQIIFHLAAQSIVRRSYEEPKLTFDTNLGGTVNVLECIRSSPFVQAAVIVTSDKCYRNVGWDWGYREDDYLGGDDPYSASKACAELAFRCYIKSYFNTRKSPRVATARAGNVIGGGDWAEHRIIPDCVRSWSQGEKTIIRSPEATRPWQYVLEPLSGYLWLGANLIQSPDNIAGESFNFGPDSKVIKSVRELVNSFLKSWGRGEWKHVPVSHKQKEAKILNLCCDKALHRLNWLSILSFQEAVELTAKWYKEYFNNKKGDIYGFSCSQIDYYVKKAIEQNVSWGR